MHSIVAPYEGEQTLELKCKAKENFDTSTHSVEAVEEELGAPTQHMHNAIQALYRPSLKAA